MEVLVSQTDAVDALIDCVSMFEESRVNARLYAMVTKPSRILGVQADVRELLRQLLDDMIEDARRYIEERVREYSKYVHIRYALLLPLPKKIVPALVVASPAVTMPELCDDEPIPVDAYIDRAFIPVKLRNGRWHRPFIARYAFGAWLGYWRHNKSRVLSVEPLRRVYERSYQKALEKGKRQRIAKIIAVKDVLRVMIGCIWLVWTYHAVKRGIVTEVPRPRHLPLERLINPIEIVVKEPPPELELDKITWSWLNEVAK